MSSDQVPFYAQAALLDQYIHASEPGEDPEILEVILELLESKKELRDYFFRSRPSAAWAPILWERDFFQAPPQPQKTKDGYTLPVWDVQNYLISVADQVPDIVIEHVKIVGGHPWHISQAIRALSFVPAEKIENVLPQVIEWLQDPQITSVATDQTRELIRTLAKDKQLDAVFCLFGELTAPVSPSDLRDVGGVILTGGAISKLRSTWDEEKVLSEDLELLRKLDIQETSKILEDHLLTALQLEAQATNSPQYEFSSWWRSAIEDTGQDSDGAYKHKLLVALRNTLGLRAEQEPEKVEPVLQRYLSENREILHRLGLYILHRFPDKYQRYVVDQLRNTKHLDNVDIHHEYFMLLQRGYPYLDSHDQEILITEIFKGPPSEGIQRLASWAQEEYGADPIEYAQHHSKRWIRDRLWMLKNYLTDQPKQILDELVEELGMPEHPAFTRWHTGMFQVQDVSAIAEEEISQMSPIELVDFIKRWEPDPGQDFGPERITYKGLANQVARIILASPRKYESQLTPIALHRPEFAYAVLDQFTIGKQAGLVPWDLSIDLCEDLLADETIRNDTTPALEVSWVSVRKSIVRLLQVGLNNSEHAIPEDHLPRVRDILIILVDDPDPVPEHDRPVEGWLGHNDPATVAINHVRPSALRGLIEYARNVVQLAGKEGQDTSPEGFEPQQLEESVIETLTRKLDRHRDPSWSVHSVYGRYLSLLYWMDKAWVVQHVEQIFPEGDDEDSIWLFTAAWDSFVAFNEFYPPILELLRSKYQRAISHLGKGYVTQTHLQPGRGLAIHVVWEYLLADYDLHSTTGQQSLIASFFRQAPPDTRGSAIWISWRICEAPSNLESYWVKIRSLWEWRVSEAASANHSTDFDTEMSWFAHLPEVSPSSETLSTLWPLLEAVLPHIARSEHRHDSWNALEDYLSQEVERDPLRVIKFYRLMYEQLTNPVWLYPREQARKIIETAAAAKETRYETLSLIDFVAEHFGFLQYRDIYERYAG